MRGARYHLSSKYKVWLLINGYNHCLSMFITHLSNDSRLLEPLNKSLALTQKCSHVRTQTARCLVFGVHITALASSELLISRGQLLAHSNDVTLSAFKKISIWLLIYIERQKEPPYHALLVKTSPLLFYSVKVMHIIVILGSSVRLIDLLYLGIIVVTHS